MNRGDCFFVCSRHILSLFIFQFVYLCLYFNLFLVEKIRCEIRMSRHAHYHKINPTLPGSSLACSGMPAEQMVPLRQEGTIFTYNTNFYILCTSVSQQIVPSRQSGTIFSYNQPLRELNFTHLVKKMFLKN